MPAILTALLILALVGCGTPTSVGAIPRIDEVRRSPNFDPKTRQFVNPVPTSNDLGFSKMRDVMRRYREHDQRPPAPIPTVRPDLPDEVGDGVFVTWLGHATTLIEIDGFRVLTDPVWSERASPFRFIGPRRHHAPPLALSELPHIDAVVISHDHYDHLDHATVEWLSLRGVRFFVPLGVGAHFERWGIGRVQELDWWEEVTLQRGDATLQLIATPARHFSGRGPFKRNRSLWASWAIRSRTRAVYFGGDTGYFDGFVEIGERVGPFDAALMPIGAYDPAWASIHLDPTEAVAAHGQLGGDPMFIPLHYATFALAPHAWAAPLDLLVEALADGKTRYALPLPGQRIDALGATLHQGWWRGL